MTITEKAAYVKGLAEGLEIDGSTKEGKIINALIDTLADMALTVSDLEEQVDELVSQMDSFDEALESLEEDVYDDDDDGHGHGHHYCDCHDDDEDEMYEVCCPTCGDFVSVDAALLERGKITCPNCGELLEFDLEDDEDEDEDIDDGNQD